MPDSTPLNLPNATLSPTNAAQEIDKLFPLNRPREEDRESEGPESFLFEMWGVVTSVAEQIPWNHPGQTRLVEVIQALKDLPGPTTVQMDDWSKLAIWSDLPLLGPVMTEHGYTIDVGDTSARLTQSGLADRSKHFSIQDFRAAFEEEPDQRSKAYLKQGPRLDVYVPLEAIWILLCGNVIFAHCRNPGTPLAGFKDAGKNWKGVYEFSIERWNFWKKRFGEIKGHDQASDQTKELAAEAEGRMNRIESEAT
ncbi:hypothetical protein BYT27DRAFT_7340991 [Phlegmacium glaucopus]|nr:hypothetical protein BYT27DRAFT_7340991 [Phlegmacium glaucopus]